MMPGVEHDPYAAQAKQLGEPTRMLEHARVARRLEKVHLPHMTTLCAPRLRAPELCGVMAPVRGSGFA